MREGDGDVTTAAAWLATLLYAVPVLVLLLVRSRRDRPLWAYAFDIPLAIAADTVIVLVLSRVVALELAVLVSRGLWLSGLAAYGFWRRPAIAWPRALRVPVLLAVAMATLVAVAISVEFSRNCHGFDRGWHIPLSVSLRGQRLPFENVYQPGLALGYHFAGDVASASLQTLSFSVLHASLALSMAHDFMYGAAAATVALFLSWRGVRSPAVIAVAAVAPLLAGPANLVWDARASQGHSIINLLKLGFRPHTAMAYLFLIGMAGALLVRSRERERPPPLAETAPILIVGTAAMALTDEVSLGLFGLATGLTWLGWPEILASKRRDGLVILLGMAVVLVGASFGLHGSLASDLGQTVSWVPTRVPGYYRSPIAFPGAPGTRVIIADLAPTVGAWMGIGLVVFRQRARAPLGSFVFLTVLLLLSTVLLMHVDIGERSIESHRFMTVAMLLVAFGAVSFAASTGPRDVVGLPHVVIAIALSLGAVGSLDWVQTEGDPASKRCPKPALYASKFDFFEVDCRKAVGAGFGLEPRLTYLEKSVAYLFAGCRPVFATGPETMMVRSDRIDRPPAERKMVPRWTTRVGRMLFERKALAQIKEGLESSTQPVDLVCARPTKDALCKAAKRAELPCQVVGEHAEICTVPPPLAKTMTWGRIASGTDR